MTVLVVCAHGTHDPAGQSVVEEITRQVAARVGADVRLAFVDVQEPHIDDVVASVTGPVVIVPLLVARGFHTEVDIATTARTRAGIVSTPPLATHPLIAELVVARLEATAGGWRDGDHIVLAAAGSRRPEAAADIEQLAALVRAAVPVPVSVGFAAAAAPLLPDAVASARAAGARRVIVASAVLAPGFFSTRLAGCGADAVTDPLGADPRIASVIADRFAQACCA